MKLNFKKEFVELKRRTPDYVKKNIGVDIEKEMGKALKYEQESGEFPKSSKLKFSSLNKKAEVVYHGGDFKPNHDHLVTYFTPNQKMAQSYADNVYTENGWGGKLTKHEISLKNPAPWEKIKEIAVSLSFDEEDIDSYTPASVFDAEIWGYDEVKDLVEGLQKLGYDGATLTDIAFGENIEDIAVIVFNQTAQEFNNSIKE